jgi:outer membrane biosynthesis protein TonB
MRKRGARRQRRLGLAWVASVGTHVSLGVACLLLGAPRYQQITGHDQAREKGVTPDEMIKFDLVASAEAAPLTPASDTAGPPAEPAKRAPVLVRHRRLRAALPEARPPVADDPAKETEPSDKDDAAGATAAAAPKAEEPKGAVKPAAATGTSDATAVATGLLGAAPAGTLQARVEPQGDVTPSEATYLRTYETFPSLPRSLWVVGRVYNVMTRVCVSADGRVSGVAVRSGAEPELDQLLVATMRSWRYRPRLVDGAARPFCHLMKVQYAVR